MDTQNGAWDRKPDKIKRENRFRRFFEGNRALLAAAAGSVAFMLFITVGSMAFLRFQMEKAYRMAEGASYESYDAYYVLIPSDRSSAFWKSVYEGALDRAGESGVYVEMLGSNLSAEYSRQELMRIAIASGVDGIILEADESARTTGLIDEADDAGIPVVTVLGDDTQSARKSFVGVNNYNLGREYGRQVLQCGDVEDVLVLMDSGMADTNRNIIFSGIQEALQEEGKDTVDIQTATIDGVNIFAIEESIREIFLGQEELPDAIICLDELSTACIYQAVVDFNRVGQVHIVGYYDSETILRGIERNVIHSTIALDTRQMGQYCVEALLEYRDMGHVNDYYSVDTNLITIANVREYMESGDDEDDNG